MNKISSRSHEVSARIAELQPFQTHGAMRAEVTDSYGPTSLGYLPSEYRESAQRASYVVYSYATPIAWVTEGRWVVPPERYSMTTSHHQGRLGVRDGEPA